MAILLALGAALSWGVAQVVTKLGLARMELVPYAALRAWFALVFVVPYGVLSGGFRFGDPGLVGVAALAGFLDSVLGTSLYMYALKRGEAHGAAALANTAPFWGVATAVILLGEPARATAFIAALLVVAGAYLLISPAGGRGRGSLPASLAALGAALLWGIAETGPAKYCLDRGMSPIGFQLVLVGTAALTWGGLALGRGRRRDRPDPKAVGIALFTALAGFFLGWILWLSGLRLAEASHLTPIRGGAMTVFAFATSMALLRERPTPAPSWGRASLRAGWCWSPSRCDPTGPPPSPPPPGAAGTCRTRNTTRPRPRWP